MADHVVVTLHENGDQIDVDIWSLSFVDRTQTDSVEDAMVWAKQRLEQSGDPFLPYED